MGFKFVCKTVFMSRAAAFLMTALFPLQVKMPGIRQRDEHSRVGKEARIPVILWYLAAILTPFQCWPCILDLAHKALQYPEFLLLQ